MGRELVERFSRRTAEIEQAARDRGITSPAEKARLGVKTRRAKAEQPPQELRDLWTSRLSESERAAIARAVPGAGVDPAAQLPAPAELPAAEASREQARRAVDLAMAHWFDRLSVVDERQLMTYAMKAAAGRASPQQLQAELADRCIVREGGDGRRLLTTESLLREEAQMLRSVQSGRGVCRRIGHLDRKAMLEQLAATPLNRQQRGAFLHIVESNDQTTAIRGAAGTGKTTLLKSLDQYIQHRGVRMLPLAPTGAAAREVLRAEGFREANTVAAYLQSPAMQEQHRGQLILVDEAGLLGVPTMNRLLQTAHAHGCRVLLMGDSRQHNSVERGDALRVLESSGALRSFELTEIVRQKGDYKLAVELLAAGEVGAGLRRLEQMGAIEVIASDEQRYARLAGDYAGALRRGEKVLAVSPTHAESHAVTAAIRRELRAARLIEPGEHRVTQLRNLNWTEGQRADADQYRPGLVVQLEQHCAAGDGRRMSRGERCTVVEVREGRVMVQPREGEPVRLPLHRPQHFHVYEAGQLAIAAGEQIRVTHGGQSIDGKRLNNGAIYTVTRVDALGHLHTAGGPVIARDFGHLAHGYCVTSYAAQGRTVDRVFVAQGTASIPASSVEQVYVSASRARRGIQIYTDDRACLDLAARRSHQRVSALELVQRGTLRTVEHLQRAAGRVRRLAKRGIDIARRQSPLRQRSDGLAR